MAKKYRFGKRSLVALVGVALALGLAGIVFEDALFRMSIRPSGRFAAAKTPPPPDYATPQAWAMAPPSPPPGAWETPWGVDVFFIHPASVANGNFWNQPFDDPASVKRLRDQILPNHAAPFLKAGPVYAPRFREAALYAELNVGGEGDGAFALAYDDVLRAFDAYMQASNRGRGVMIVGIGQGGLYALRLVKDRMQSDAMKERLAAAYIIGAAVPAAAIGKDLAQPICASHDAIHCINAWTPIAADDASERRRFLERSPVWTDDETIAISKGQALLCLNPLTWTPGPDLAPRTAHRGGARARGPQDLDPQILANAVSARCRDGVLEVDRPASPQLQRPHGWDSAYTSPAFNLFYADIAFNAAERARVASAWLDEHARKPARPLPPPIALPDAPIHRPDGVADPLRP